MSSMFNEKSISNNIYIYKMIYRRSSRIFSGYFVKQNKNKCRIIYNNKN